MLEPLPPQQNPHLFGHDAAASRFMTAFQSGRMHHAWLITGMEGIGKTTLAYHMAHYVMSGGQNIIGAVNPAQPAARLIAAEAHPDMFVLRRALDDKSGELKDSIAAEDARQIAPFLRRTATHGGWRIALIDEAHRLNRHGQNAILKIIEEPPRNSLIIMTVTAAGALLPTIRSRCSLLALQPLEALALQQALDSQGINLDDNSDAAQLIDLAQGSAGFLMRLLQTEALEFYGELQSLLNQFSMVKLHQLADRIGKKADGELYDVIVRLIIDHGRREIVQASQAGQGSLAQKLAVWDKIRNLFNQTDYARLDRKLAFVQAVTTLHQAA
jgi:DNA polymerase-3 subunit delta'